MRYLRYGLTLLLTGLLTTVPYRCVAETEQSEHPLDPLLAEASEALQRLRREIPGYTCTFVKRERVEGKLMPTEQMRLKVRHQKTVGGAVETPFSVYAFYEKSRTRGRELLFIDGQNDGRMLVRNGGRRLPNLTLFIDPLGSLAMKGNRYPINTIGIEQLLQRLVTIGSHEKQWGECEVMRTPGITVAGRDCTLIEIKHPVPRPYFQYYLTRIFKDEELVLPIRFEAYLWPDEDDERPSLLEQYTYLNLRLEAPTDRDFDPDNEAYSFRLLRPKQAAKSDETVLTLHQVPVDEVAEPAPDALQPAAKESEQIAISGQFLGSN